MNLIHTKLRIVFQKQGFLDFPLFVKDLYKEILFGVYLLKGKKWLLQ